VQSRHKAAEDAQDEAQRDATGKDEIDHLLHDYLGRVVVSILITYFKYELVIGIEGQKSRGRKL
jgi:hypothetical protein